MLNETLECCCRAPLKQRSMLPYCGTAADWIGVLDDSGRPLFACDRCFGKLNNKQNKILNETLWYFYVYPSPINRQGKGKEENKSSGKDKTTE